MSITIIPRAPDAHGAGSTAGKLATTLLSVAVAGMAEPSRFRRGRSYFTDRAVTRLDVAPGIVRGTVAGSRHEPYVTEVRTALTARPPGLSGAPQREHVVRLAPDADDLDATCSCPDEGTPCKHVVATLLCFAAELGDRPELLAEWRCPPGPAADRAVVGSRARASERHLRLVPPPPAPSPFESDEWRAFAASTSQVPTSWGELLDDRPDVTVGTVMVEHVDIGRVVASAVESLMAP
ncbi:MAG: SWIM zinc finger family protein [Ilumatobacteraceae bacterium]